MASTAQLRSWWSAYRCITAKYTYVGFPGVLKEWRLPVASPSADLWRAFAEVMTAHRYLFRESAGGTYNCRRIAGSDNYSLHAYAIALDLNPSRNPYNTRTTDMPPAFRDDLKAIRTTRGTQAFTWGGDWSTGPDPMHWQLNVSPSDTELLEEEPDMSFAKTLTAAEWRELYDLGFVGGPSADDVANYWTNPARSDAQYDEASNQIVMDIARAVRKPTTGVHDHDGDYIKNIIVSR